MSDAVRSVPGCYSRWLGRTQEASDFSRSGGGARQIPVTGEPTGKYTVIAATVLHMIAVAIPNVPRAYVDYARFPLLSGVHQYETYGTDTIGNSYVAKVVLNDPLDMYTKARLEQTPLEKATWTREASAPYPPAGLLTAAGLYAIGEAIGIGFYGMVLLLATLFIALSLWYFLNTRWYLFPLLYLNFAYFGHRFVYVQDDSYLAMLVVVMIALILARSRRDASHLLMALAITMKLSPAVYVWQILTMRRGIAMIFVAILFAGFVLPYVIWDNYLTIFTFHDQVKGNIYDTVAAVILVVPFSIVLWYVETRLGFDMEDRIGWSLVPFAMFVGIKMRVARHLLIVLLVPDKRVRATSPHPSASRSTPRLRMCSDSGRCFTSRPFCSSQSWRIICGESAGQRFATTPGIRCAPSGCCCRSRDQVLWRHSRGVDQRNAR